MKKKTGVIPNKVKTVTVRPLKALVQLNVVFDDGEMLTEQPLPPIQLQPAEFGQLPEKVAAMLNQVKLQLNRGPKPGGA